MGERKPFMVELLDRKMVERLAHIVGASSAASQALAELDRRPEAGEDLVLVQPLRSNSILIVPRGDLKMAPWGVLGNLPA